MVMHTVFYVYIHKLFWAFRSLHFGLFLWKKAVSCVIWTRIVQIFIVLHFQFNERCYNYYYYYYCCCRCCCCCCCYIYCVGQTTAMLIEFLGERSTVYNFLLSVIAKSMPIKSEMVEWPCQWMYFIHHIINGISILNCLFPLNQMLSFLVSPLILFDLFFLCLLSFFYFFYLNTYKRIYFNVLC